MVLSAVDPNDVWALDWSGVLIVRRIDGNWTTECLPPGALALYALHVAADDDVWVGGTDGDHAFIAHWDGTGWTRTDTPATSTVLAITGDELQAFAVVSDGSLLAFDGSTWRETYRSSPPAACRGCDAWQWQIAADGGTALALTDQLLVWTGADWCAATNIPSAVEPQAIWVSPRGQGWAGGTNTEDPLNPRAVLFKLIDGALTPERLPDWGIPYAGFGWMDGTDEQVWALLKTDFRYAQGTLDVVRRTGDTWSAALQQTPLFLAHLVLRADDAFFGSATEIYHWIRDVLPPARVPAGPDLEVAMEGFWKVVASPPTDVWLLGWGTSYETTSWHRTVTGWEEVRLPGVVSDVATSAPDNTWFAGGDYGGGLFTLRWDGTQLLRATLPFDDFLPLFVATFAPDATWVASRQRMARWDGASWREIDAAPFGVNKLWAVSRNEVWATGSTIELEPDGILHRVTHIIRFNGDGTLRRDLVDYGAVVLWGSSPADVWVSARGESACELGRETNCARPSVPELLLHWNGSSWTDSTEFPPVTAMSGTSGSDVWAVAGYSDPAIYRFDGAAWLMMAQTRTPDDPSPYVPSAMAVLPDGEIWGLRTGEIVHRRPHGLALQRSP